MLSRNLRPLYLLLVVLYVVFAQPKVPPSIVEGPPANGTYFTDDPGSRLMLPCRATGNPTPTYRWTHVRNGQERVIPSASGTYTSDNEPPMRTDDGDYQCFAWNDVGQAMSNTTTAMFVRRAVFPDQTAIPYTATIGDKLKLRCEPSFAGVPPPQYNHYSWHSSGTRWEPDGRVQIDDSGNLNIAAVTQEDIDDQKVWRCKISNPINDVDASGSESKIVSSGKPDVTVQKPAIMFYTNQTSNPSSSSTVVVGLEGQSVSLRCFFSGSGGRVTVAWSRADGVSIPSTSRFQRFDESVRLQISQLERNDEAVYVCIGSIGTVSSDQFRLELHVHAVPTFKQVSHRPHDYNATVGRDVEFHCNAYAIPDASVVWYKNGEKIDANTQPSKFQFSGDGKTLTISSVCKNNCDGGGNDLMVIQCMASNQHGYVLANGYVNVFEPTTLVTTPENVTPNFPDPVTFTVKATSDPDTEVKYTWYRHDEQSACEDKWCVIHHVSNKTHITTTNNGSSLTIYNTGVDDLGQYRCVATNGVDQVTHEVTLVTPPDLDKSKLWPFWWVPLLIILLILIILIIILCCCCWMRRNRGDEYPVDEKERAADRDPEKELADSGFHDYQRQDAIWSSPASGGRVGPSGSLSSSVGKIGSDDDQSLNDYASLTPGKFTEDGSFIGEYNPAMKYKSSRAPPAYQSQA